MCDGVLLECIRVGCACDGVLPECVRAGCVWNGVFTALSIAHMDVHVNLR